MLYFNVADVGDGLCCVLATHTGETIQIDWGTQQGGPHAYGGWIRLRNEMITRRFSPGYPHAFILSHFHTDHYNGLLHASFSPPHSIPWVRTRDIITAGLPEIPERENFCKALFAVGSRVLGSLSGHMEYDFIRALSRLTEHALINYTRVFQGDHFIVGDTQFECIWPPKLFGEKNFTTKVYQALEKFNEALSEDPILADIHGSIRDDRLLEFLMNPESGTSELLPDDRYLRQEIRSRRDYEGEIPLPVQEANRELRAVANDLSLAFHDGYSFVSFGDLTGARIARAVDYLDSVNARDFKYLVAPHHGTHWHNKLKTVRCVHAIVSNGPKLWKKYRREYASISQSVHATYITGDISV